MDTHEHGIALDAGEPFEPVVLRDGRAARLFALRAVHAPELVRGFSRLSPRSRYLRFFAPKRELTPAELQWLTDVNGSDHFALGVEVRTVAGWEGAAVGRLARMPHAPDTAEIAITVIDDYQNLGIGRLLLDRLRVAALARGYVRVRGEILAENRPMLHLLRSALPHMTAVAHGPIVVADAELAEPLPLAS